MSDRRLREAERDYHTGRISGEEWRDILLARDPDRLTVGWSGPEIPDWAGLMIAAEEIQRGSILSADEMGHAVIARPSSPTWNFAGIAINSADGGEIVTVKKRGVFDIHVDISLSVGAFVK